MKRYILVLGLALVAVIGLSQLSSPQKVFAATGTNLTTTTSNINGVKYAWANASQITGTFQANPPGKGTVVTFTDGNGPGDIGLDKTKLAQFRSGGNGDCNIGGTTGQSVIDANNGLASAEQKTSGGALVIWKYLPPNTQQCTADPKGTDNAPKKQIAIADPTIDGTLASHIIYSYSGSQITIIENSGDQTQPYKQSSSNPNIYTEGTGQCAQEIVVNSDGSAYLWPLTSPGGGSKNESTSTQGVSNANAGGCGVNDNSTADNYDLNIEEGLAFSVNGGVQNKDNGTIPVTVPGLLYVVVSTNPDGTTTCTAGGQTATCPTAPASGTAATTTCQSSGGPFSWFVCAAINGITDAENDIIGGIIVPLLKTQPIDLNSCSNSSDSTGCSSGDIVSSGTYKVWSSIRIYGNILLVIGLLAVVFAETIGGGIGEAYTIKKMLPRILVAAILINISIYLVTGLEDIVNVLGSSVQSLLESPFQNAGGGAIISVGGATGLFTSGGIAALAIGAGFTEGIAGIFLFIVAMLLLAAIGILITLMLRQGLLIVLLVVSPVAFALYCLPNTEQYFRKWWDLLVKTLLVDPIVMVVFALADISSIIMSSIKFPIAQTYPLLSQLMAILAATAPLFLIPFAFKLSGGAIGSIHGAVSGVKDRVKAPIDNARKQNRANRLQRAGEGHLFRGDSRMAQRASAIAQGTMMANKVGLNPRKMRGRFQSARSAAISAAAAKAGESQAASAVLGNDDLLSAALAGNRTEADARNFLANEKGQSGALLAQNVASITQARREMGRQAFDDAALTALPGTGTGFEKEGQAGMLKAINAVAGSDRARAGRLLNGMRGSAERARRVDLYGSGFGVSLKAMDSLYNGTQTDQQVNEVTGASVLASKSADEIGSSRNNGLQLMVPAMQSRLAAAQSAVVDAQNNPTIADQQGRVGQAKILGAERDYKHAMAGVANILDSAGRFSPDNALTIADGVMAQPIIKYEDQPVIDPGTGKQTGIRKNVQVTQTVAQSMESMRDDPEFQQFRREYSRAQLAQMQATGGPGTTTPNPQNQQNP